MIFSEPPKELNKSWEILLNPHNDDRRKWLQFLWNKFKPYAPPSFQKDIETDEGKLNSLTWEMLLANILLDNGFSLRKSEGTDEPDLCVLDGNKQIWIECCIPTKGEPSLPDSVPDKKYDGTFQGIDKDKSSLRCMQVLKDKKEQHLKWINKNICQKKEPFVIAVHGREIDFSIYKSPSFTDIFRCLYSMGDPYLAIDPSGEHEAELKNTITPEILKIKTRNPVNTNFFCRTENSNISGVIFSNHWFNYTDSSNSPEFCFVNNVNADNECPLSFSSFAQEYNEESIMIMPNNI